jgi:hypothetical protein
VIQTFTFSGFNRLKCAVPFEPEDFPPPYYLVAAKSGAPEKETEKVPQRNQENIPCQNPVTQAINRHDPGHEDSDRERGKEEKPTDARKAGKNQINRTEHRTVRY